jgi:hypothetical protein
MPDSPQSQSDIVLYQTEDGRTRIQCRFVNATVWLTQALIAELFEKDVRTVNEHLVNIFEEGELSREATIRRFRIVRLEGTREVARNVEHYSLPAILAVGYRVRSPRGTQFRQWATARLGEYLVKGFTVDDERLKNPPGKGHVDYFDELLERIRDIRASERRVYLRVREILALAADYSPSEPETQVFFQTVQNKLHFAATGKTAPELIAERAILPDTGRMTREQADAMAETAYDRFAGRRRARLEEEGEADTLKQLEDEVKTLSRRKKPGRRKTCRKPGSARDQS